MTAKLQFLQQHILAVPVMYAYGNQAPQSEAICTLLFSSQPDVLVTTIILRLLHCAILSEVDSTCKKWKKPTLLLFGQHDPFINAKSTFEFLQNKRTNFELAQTATKVRHCQQEAPLLVAYQADIVWQSHI